MYKVSFFSNVASIVERKQILPNRIMFQTSFKDSNRHSGLERRLANASPPVMRPGITVFKFSAELYAHFSLSKETPKGRKIEEGKRGWGETAYPILLLDKSSSFKCKFLRNALTKVSHSKSSTSAFFSVSLINGLSGLLRYAANFMANIGPVIFSEKSKVSRLPMFMTASMRGSRDTSVNWLFDRLIDWMNGRPLSELARSTPILSPIDECYSDKRHKYESDSIGFTVK